MAHYIYIYYIHIDILYVMLEVEIQKYSKIDNLHRSCNMLPIYISTLNQMLHAKYIYTGMIVLSKKLYVHFSNNL